MTQFVESQIAAAGSANVICLLKASRRDGSRPTQLEKHFAGSDISQLAFTWRVSEGLAAASSSDSLPPADRAEHPDIPPDARMRFYPHLGVAYGTVTDDGYAALRQDDDVEEVVGAPQLSLIRPVAVEPAGTPPPVAWGLETMGVAQLWEQGLTGQGVTVAHLDTGVDGGHPALETAIAQFANFDDLGRLMDPAAPYDTAEHGTHTAGTIAGRAVDGVSIGVAPEARMACGIVIEGGDTVARVLGGLDWSIEQNARVLSMSLGFRGWWDDFVPLIQVLRQNGVVPVIAVGNEGPGTSRSPGNYPEAISVGAHDQSGAVAAFSSSQYFPRQTDAIVPDVLAPGVDIHSAKPGGGFQLMSGTSMATPHVAGLVALLAQADPDATVDRLEQAVLESATPLTTGPQGVVRLGIVHAGEALTRLRATQQ